MPFWLVFLFEGYCSRSITSQYVVFCDSEQKGPAKCFSQREWVRPRHRKDFHDFNFCVELKTLLNWTSNFDFQKMPAQEHGRHLAPKGVQALQISHAQVLLDVLFGWNPSSQSRRHTKYSSLLRAPHHTAAPVPFTVGLTLFAGVLSVVLLRIRVFTNNFPSLEWTGGTN